MSRYLAYTSPARGHLYPIVPTLLELRDRGHEVHVRTLASELPALEAVGLDAAPIAPAIEQTPLTDFEAADPAGGLAKAFETFTERARHEVPDLRRAIAEVGPDALLIDITTVGAAALAEAESLPWAEWIPLFQHFSFDPSVPSVVTHVPFGIDPSAGIEVLNGPRREVGLPPLTGPHEIWRAPLHLYFTAPPFEDEGLEFPPSFEFVGPGVWEPPAEAPPGIDDLGEPLVLVTVSSEFQGDDGLIATALEALGDEDLGVAVTTAAHDPGRFEAPANVRLERWLPHAHLVQRAACVVCHGGMGITQKALAAGVPVCVVPYGRDQFEVAGRVAAAGAGTVVPPDALNAESLRTAVHRAIAMRAGAEKVAEGFARTGGAGAAAAAFESLAYAAPGQVAERGEARWATRK
jgi:MGT family glycosyltransferase